MRPDKLPFVVRRSRRITMENSSRRPSGVHCLLYHDRDTFDLSQGHVTKNQPVAVPVLIAEWKSRNITMANMALGRSQAIDLVIA